MTLDGVAALQFAMSGRFAHAYAIFRAHMSTYRHFRVHFQKRNDVGNKKYYYVKSIVFMYYVRKKRFFKSLF